MFNKILVAIDGSEMSEKALEAGLHLAKEQRAEVTLVHVERNITIPVGLEGTTVDSIYDSIKKEGSKGQIDEERSAHCHNHKKISGQFIYCSLISKFVF